MHFESPRFLLLLAPLVAWSALCVFLLIRNYRLRQIAFADTSRHFLQLPAWVLTAKIASQVLLALAAASLLLALARPQGSSTASTSASKGVNLAILVDGSRSMLCEDVLPSRLRVAQQAVESLVTTTAGSRFSLFMFGGAPTLLIPQTFDTAAVSLAARSVSPNFIGKGGTALDPALKRAANYLSKSSKGQPKVIVILSDGEEGEGDPLLTGMQLRTEYGIRIHTITVGTEDGGPIPQYQRNPKGELVASGVILNVSGQPIPTRADPTLMAKLADGASGRTIQLTGGDIAAQVRALAEQAILPDAVALDDVATQEPRELFWIPLSLALALLLGEQALRRYVAHRFALRPGIRRRGAILDPAKQVRA